MEIDKDRIVTQEETGEPAPIDQVEERVEAKMKKIEAEAKKLVADGLQDPDLASEADRLNEAADKGISDARDSD